MKRVTGQKSVAMVTHNCVILEPLSHRYIIYYIQKVKAEDKVIALINYLNMRPLGLAGEWRHSSYHFNLGSRSR
jgi:hypothetical protein